MKTWEEATKLNRTDILMLVFYIMNGILDITVSIISENKTWIICGLLWITIALIRYCDLKIIKENEATINMPIARNKKDRKKMAVDKEGKEAITHFKVLKRYDKYTLLEVKIDTGRTHQIRVHMAEIGHPVIGDEVYSNGKNEFNVKGQMLHAKSLDFEHPITGKKMHLEAELPDYFKKVIDICEERLKRGE